MSTPSRVLLGLAAAFSALCFFVGFDQPDGPLARQLSNGCEGALMGLLVTAPMTIAAAVLRRKEPGLGAVLLSFVAVGLSGIAFFVLLAFSELTQR